MFYQIYLTQRQLSLVIKGFDNAVEAIFAIVKCLSQTGMLQLSVLLS